MTAHEHPISDADLDAALGTASAHLNDTLARTVNIDAGLTAITQAQTTPTQTGPRDTADPPDNSLPRRAEPASAESPHSVTALIADALGMIDNFPRGLGPLGREAVLLIARVRARLVTLDTLLARRALTRQQARIMLHNVNVHLDATVSHLLGGSRVPARRVWIQIVPFSALTLGALGGAVLSAVDAVASMLTSAITMAGLLVFFLIWKRPLVAASEHDPTRQQYTACKDLRGHLKRLEAAVEKLFDDAEDRSVTGCH